MTRTREWTKFGFLVAVTILLAVGFAAAVDFPRITQAQERVPATLVQSSRDVIPQARPASELGEAFAAVAEIVRPAVVYIQAQSARPTATRNPFDDFIGGQPDQIRRGSGSGFLISEEGHIITNNHVVEGANRITVRLLDRRSFEAEIIGADPLTDIAVIKIEGDNFKPVALGTSSDVRIGEWALAVGNPLGEAFSFTVTAGIVSGQGRRLDNLRRGAPGYSIHDFIQTDAAINPGNSGGPLVNIAGEVIGVNAAIASQTGTYTGYSFAVPIDLARSVAEQLIRDGYVTRAVLGIQINDADALDAEFVGLDSIFGVKVEGFGENSPSQRAGIQQGDVIIAVDGEPALYTAQLQTKVGFMTPGENVTVTVAREGGELFDFTVELQEAEAVRTERQVANVEPERRRRGSVNPTLGVEVESYTRGELVQEFGIDRSMADALSGLRITQVDPNGPARDGRLRTGEFITHVNGIRVLSEADLRASLTDVAPRQIISVRTAFVNQEAVQTRTVRIRAGGD